MKYLIKYNENQHRFKIESKINKFTELTENYLAYLKDDNFDFEILEDKGCEPGYLSVKIAIRKNPEEFETFIWDDIKDQVLPFIHLLKENYNLFNITVYTANISCYKYTDLVFFDKVIDKELGTKKLRAILFYVE